MLDQVHYSQFDDDLKASLNNQLHPFVGESIAKLIKALKLKSSGWVYGDEAQDRAGADVVIFRHDSKKTLSVDLKLMTTDKAKRIALEWEKGENQKATPWAVSEKSDVVLWVHTQQRWAYYAIKSRLREKLLDQSLFTQTMLSRAFINESRTRLASGETFKTKCHLIDRPSFEFWLNDENIGGALC